MSFFDKMKQGASGAAKKAQQTVEVTKLRSQISSKEKEMDKLYARIGESIYRAFSAGDVALSETEVMEYCDLLHGLDQEIDRVEEKIRNIKFEKTCSCGSISSVGVKFCPDCGKRFPDEPKQEDTLGEIRILCNGCQAENDINAKFCIECGEELKQASGE